MVTVDPQATAMAMSEDAVTVDSRAASETMVAIAGPTYLIERDLSGGIVHRRQGRAARAPKAQAGWGIGHGDLDSSLKTVLELDLEQVAAVGEAVDAARVGRIMLGWLSPPSCVRCER
jgi:hypothetical protein